MSVQISYKDDKLVITVDVGKSAIRNATPSSTGRTLIVASTNGFARIGNTGLKVSLNVTTPNTPKPKKPTPYTVTGENNV